MSEEKDLGSCVRKGRFRRVCQMRGHCKKRKNQEDVSEDKAMKKKIQGGILEIKEDIGRCVRKGRFRRVLDRNIQETVLENIVYKVTDHTHTGKTIKEAASRQTHNPRRNSNTFMMESLVKPRTMAARSNSTKVDFTSIPALKRCGNVTTWPSTYTSSSGHFKTIC